jgi:pimeloyl-ACP methyl ester carboxylesterase
MSTILDFEVPFDGMALKADHYVGRDSNRILYLHGAGGTRRGHHLLRGALQQRGLGSVCFDAIGHGDTGGTFAQSSVASRTRQAQAVLAARALPEPLVVFGSSMGAYNAIRLTQQQRRCAGADRAGRVHAGRLRGAVRAGLLGRDPPRAQLGRQRCVGHPVAL